MWTGRLLAAGLGSAMLLGALAGCMRQDYIQGLRLPPGSHLEKSELYSENGYTPIESEAMEACARIRDYPLRNVMKQEIKFISAGDWLSVAEHFDHELAGKDFALVMGDDIEGLRRMMDSAPHSVSKHRSYAHEAEPMVAILYDVTRFHKVLLGLPETSPRDSDEFALVIVRLDQQ